MTPRASGPALELWGLFLTSHREVNLNSGEGKRLLRLSASRNLYKSFSFIIETLAELAKAAVLERGGVHTSALKPLFEYGLLRISV